MPFIKKESIDNLLARVNLLDVASSVTQLKRVGSSYCGLSPFQAEKTPSFYINPDKGLYKCFSSGKAGNLFHFVMETENLTFPEAVETIASRFGIELEYEEGGLNREERSLRQELLDIHDLATAHFHDFFLSDDPVAIATRDYWTGERAFTLELAREEKIGLAPLRADVLLRQLRKKGFRDEALAQCGLFYQRQGAGSGESFYPRFRHRLMIPIRDIQGRVVAFTARKLPATPADDPTAQAKYVNSPETPLFHKNQLLFGLDRARTAASDDTPFILVEGQLDVLRCRTVGLNSAIAPQGTAISEHQLLLLKRSGAGIQVMLDSDQAGQKAGLRLIPLALSTEVTLTFLPLPTGEDPDSFLRSHGAEGYALLRAQAMHPVPFAIARLFPTETRAKASPEDKLAATKAFFGLLQTAESDLLIREYLQMAAAEFGLPELVLAREFSRFRQGQFRPPPSASTSNKDAPASPDRRDSAEKSLLVLALEHEDVGQAIAQNLDPEWIDQERIEGRLLDRVLAEYLHDMWAGKNHADHLADNEEERIFINSLLFDVVPAKQPWELANMALRSLFARYMSAKMKEIENEIANRGETLNDDILFLQRKRLELRKLKSNPPILHPSVD